MIHRLTVFLGHHISMLRQAHVLFGIVLAATLCVNGFSFRGVSRNFVDSIRISQTELPLFSSQVFGTESANRVFELGDWSLNVAKGLANIVFNTTETLSSDDDGTLSVFPVTSAMEKMNINLLDDVTSRTPQLTTVELAVLLTTISLSALSPFFLNIDIIEVLVPSLAALSASVGISAEYIGKIAVSNGKEFAALAIIAAAEAEAMLAAAERTKSVLPLCVGLATMASAIALVAPLLFKGMSDKFKIEIAKQYFFICPMIAMIASAIAGLATSESQELASKAISTGGNNSGNGNNGGNNSGSGKLIDSSPLGRLMEKHREEVTDIEKYDQRMKAFLHSMIPPLTSAALFPGCLSIKCIVCAALATAQSAYYLVLAEYSIALATDSVALKARSAAVSDFYANQSSRAGAILPFTSALAGFCAAASAAAVELLPFVNTVEQALVALIFPSGAALFAAAAAVSKARCEVILLCIISESVYFILHNFVFVSVTDNTGMQVHVRS